MASQVIIWIDVYLLTHIASLIFKADSLARTMYRGFDIVHFLDLHPDYGLENPPNFNGTGAMHIHQELELVFNKPGWSKLVPHIQKPSRLISGRRKYPKLW